jgi:hypothetical protein
MANVLKYKTSQPTKRGLRKGNVVLGTGDENYGPSSTTGYYSGVDVPEDGFVVYTLGLNNNPKVFVAQTEDDLPAIARTLGGGVLTVLESKNYLQTLANTWVLDSLPKNKLTDGLRLNLDARVESSFLDNQPTINLAGNPDFSNGTTGWNANQNVTLSVETINGTRFLKAKSNQTISTPGFKSSNITVSGNTTYTLTIRAYKNDSRSIFLYATGNGTGGSDIVWSNASYNGPNPITTELTTISRTFTTPSDMTYLQIGALWSGPLTTSEVYVEYMQLEEKSTATPFISGSRSQNTTWYDLSGYGNNFTSMNNMTFTSHSFDFNGVDSGVQNNISSYNPDSADSVLECLFKPMDLSGEQAIFSDNYGPEFGFWIHTNGKLRAIAYASVYADLEIGKWYHAIMNIDPGATKSSSDQTYVQLYLNGEYIGQSNANTGNGMNDQPFTLGYDYRSGSPTRYFSGSIAAASVYYGQFTQEEVSQNYYGGPIVTDGLTFAADAGNLVSYESGSTTAYSMTGSYSTSLVNGVGYSNNNGGAWIFDGVNDYINVSAFNVSYLTIDTWVYRTSTTTHQGISRKQNEWALSQYNGTLQIAIGPAWYFLNTGYTIPLNTWTHITYTYSGTNQIGSQIVYINGEEIFSATDGFGPISAGGSTYRIGYDDNGWFWGGKIANQKIYNRALSNAEVLQNYNAQKARFGL